MKKGDMKMWKKDILFKWHSIWITGYCERTTNGGTVSLKMQLKIRQCNAMQIRQLEHEYQNW